MAEYGNDGVFGDHPHGHGDGPESSLALPPPENSGLDLVVQPLVFPIILMPNGLAVIRPRVLQVLGLILGIIQLALGIALLFTALDVQALAIQALLR